ncbi:MAG: LapA family protein [Deltaproteobacteria bacterium]|nr:LapA family protein [Deltaproteobacteria bacterium]MBW2360315.1 LapA family protein [Deltaproteobacteria bacterium]
MRWFRRILWGGLIVGLVFGSHYFVQNNEQAVTLDFAVLHFEAVALWMVLLCAFTAGFGVAAAAAMLRGARLRFESRRYRKEARKLEAEVHELRTLPLATPGDGSASLPDATSSDGLSRGT